MTLVANCGRRDCCVALDKSDDSMTARHEKVASSPNNRERPCVIHIGVGTLQQKRTIVLFGLDAMVKRGVDIEGSVRRRRILAGVLLSDAVEGADGANLLANHIRRRGVWAHRHGLVDEGNEAFGGVGDQRRVGGRNVSAVVLVKDQLQRPSMHWGDVARQ